MPFDNTLKRMYILARGMHEDAISTLRTRNRALAEDVISRDDEIDRLQWLLARQYHLIVTDGNLSKRMGMPVGTPTNSLMISRIVERIGDHAVNIATNALALMEEELDGSLITDIESASAVALSIFDTSVRSLFHKNILESNANIKAVTALVSRCEEISHDVLQEESLIAISIGYIPESVRRLGEYSKDLSENVINYLVNEQQDGSFPESIKYFSRNMWHWKALVMSAEIVEVMDATWEKMVEKGEKPAVVMFYSPECPYCRTMEPHFQTLAERYGEVILFARLNSAANLWTAERYGVRGTPTFKFFCRGRPVAELVGAVYPAMLEKRIEDLLEHGEECIRRSTATDYEITGYG